MKNRMIIRKVVVIVLITVFSLNLFDYSNCRAENSQEKMSGVIKAESYKMDIKLNVKKDRLAETVDIQVKNDTNKSVKRLYFRNMADSVIKYDKENYETKVNKKKKSVIKSVTMKDVGNLEVMYKKDKSIFYVDLGKNALEPGENAQFTISAMTDIPKREDLFGYWKIKKGKLYTLSFCYPYLAVNKNGTWDLDPYFDDGESRASEVTNYTVTFTAPKNYTVAASGKHETNDGITMVQADHMRDFAIVACNRMKKDTFKASGVTVNSYYLPGKYQKRFRAISKKVAKDAIRIYTKKIGTYAYENLDMTPGLFGYGFGGMEYPGLVMNNATAYSGKGTDTAIYDPYSLQEVISHEIAHQWFYAAVGNDEYKEGWIDEGFTTYCEKVLYGLSNTKSMRYVMKIAGMKINLKSIKKDYKQQILDEHKKKKHSYINIPVNKYSKDQIYGDQEYDGANLFLGELKLVMGNKKFEQFIKDYYKTYYLKKVTTSDILELIRKYNNSKEINKVINKYISKKYLKAS